MLIGRLFMWLKSILLANSLYFSQNVMSPEMGGNAILTIDLQEDSS